MRKFGIELEMIGPAGVRDPLERAAELIRATGLRVTTNTHYGRNYEQWQVKPDGSLLPFGRGAEVVSRILPGTPSSYDEIRRALAPLEPAGFGINRSCGFHVHINIADLTPVQRQLVVLRYAQLQDDISAMMPPSRRANSYAPPMGAREFRVLCDHIDARREGFVNVITQRYSVTNVQWIAQAGDGARIEFRQAAATCNASKVIGWVSFLQEMIDEVVRRSMGVTFGARANQTIQPAPIAPRPVLSTRMTPTSHVPTMRPGSDNHRALMQLCQTGVVTPQWATANGMQERVLRRIISGWRRHGAPIATVSQDQGAVYTLPGTFTIPTTPERVFNGATVVATLEQPLTPYQMALAWWIARGAAGAAAWVDVRGVARAAAWGAAGAAAWDAARAAALDGAWDAARAAARAAASQHSDGAAAWNAVYQSAQASVRAANLQEGAPAAPPVSASPTVQARDFIAYPFAEGLSETTRAWCADRRDTFQASEAADTPQAGRAA